MLAEEITIGIYPEGKLTDILIEPDGHEFHLFITGSKDAHDEYVELEHAQSVGSIVFVNEDWVYEGSGLSQSSLTEIADFIKSY